MINPYVKIWPFEVYKVQWRLKMAILISPRWRVIKWLSKLEEGLLELRFLCSIKMKTEGMYFFICLCIYIKSLRPIFPISLNSFMNLACLCLRFSGLTSLLVTLVCILYLSDVSYNLQPMILTFCISTCNMWHNFWIPFDRLQLDHLSFVL